MRTLVLFVSMFSFSMAWAQDSSTQRKRIYIEQYLRTGAVASVNCNPPGNCVGGAAGLNRNISSEATKGFMKSCPLVTVTDNREAADYVLRINPGSSTLYGQNGDVAYISPAKMKVSNLVKDICNYIKVH